MNSMALVFIGVIVVIIILIIFVILNLSNSSSNSKKSSLYSSSDSSSTSNKAMNSKITVTSISLPKKIMGIDPKVLHSACKTVFDSFKALDYKDGNVDKLSKSEWHSWQVSLLLAFLKIEREFHIGNPREYFPDAILSMTKKELNIEIDRILKKYDNNVDFNKDRDTLSNHTIWTAREVGILLYYMAMSRIL